MGCGKKRSDKAGVSEDAPRLTRLRSQIHGAPKLMRGLNTRNRASESLPPDPERLSARAVLRRLPPSHPKRRPRIKIVGRLASAGSTDSGRGGPPLEKPAPVAEPKQGVAGKTPEKRKFIKWIKSNPETPALRSSDPWLLRLALGGPPASQNLVKFRTEGLFDIKQSSSEAEQDGVTDDSEGSGMPGAKRLRSRADFEHRRQSTEWQPSEPAVGGPLSSPCPSPRTIVELAVGQGASCAS